MYISRRGFIKLTGMGLASLGLSGLGFNLRPVRAYAAGLKIEGSKEILSICGFCSCGCNIIMSVRDGRMVSSEGDPDYPVSEGTLCSKGAAFLSMHNNEHRLQRPKYRAPGSDKWEEKDWDFVLERIARRVKDNRDQDFLLKNGVGQQVNRVETIFQLGSSQMDNEECAVSHQMLRGLGVVYIDHQARV
ncbi:Molybdopterin oxidoreductase Fe4S4 region [uncultured Desulfobacterium sp.]|uniref:Molybdopterin oxidoreductase Fe4S4 region n=1 Tax=uncultured Desulfobacterium sp. TaxID=201089 RepID=A0A445N2E6_9BACT|nr:Molybdopterin oxidoreductase Fe4S4 region [uncultured Desulfobacterium sp.]